MSSHSSSGGTTSQRPTRKSAASGVEDDAPLDVLAEQQSFLRVERAFRDYRDFAVNIVKDKRGHYSNVQPRHKALLPNYDSHFDRMNECIEANAGFLRQVVQHAARQMFEAYWPDGSIVTEVEAPTPLDLDKVLSTFRQYVRDWSEEGKPERDACYAPVLEAIERAFPDPKCRVGVRVVVPGAGLSRLAYEIYIRGFCSQGSEFSHHMLIGGSYILNHVTRRHQHTIYPFVHHICNNRSRVDMLRPIRIPDVAPIEEVQKYGDPGGQFSMCAGDFLEVYRKPHEIGATNVVVTCFFIDTAHNIFEYIETICRMLVPGGVWINIGPLLWHFADQMQEQSIELAWDDVRSVIVQYGFNILEEREVSCAYTSNRRGLMTQTYTAIFFHAVKMQ